MKIIVTNLRQLAWELTFQAVPYYGNPNIPDALLHGYNKPLIGQDYAAPAAPNPAQGGDEQYGTSSNTCPEKGVPFTSQHRWLRCWI